MTKSGVTKAWRQIEEVLLTHCPAVCRRLGRPATSEQIARLERSLGLALPGDLAHSLKVHNGMRNNFARQFSAIEYDHLLTCSEMARDCKMLRKIVHDLRPWRIALSLGAYAVVEMSSGAVDRSDVEVGDRLMIGA